jgi:hypothetical protein
MYKLSPSDFAYLYEECKLCYYLKIKHGITQPKMPMPGVFSAINSLIQGNLVGKDLHTLSDKLPNGLVESQEGWVESKQVPDTNIFIKGKYDLLVKLGDGSHLLVDLKMSKAGDDKIDKYGSQLNAYKFALENPATGTPLKITRLGLLMFYPDEVKFENETTNLTFPPDWLEVPIDDTGFLGFAKTIDTLIAGPTPEESESCQLCKYRHLGDELTHYEPPKDEIPF